MYSGEKKELRQSDVDTTLCIFFSSFVGVAGFEPTTPCSQSRCANRTALHPETFSYLEKRCKDTAFFQFDKLFRGFFFMSVCNMENIA